VDSNDSGDISFAEFSIWLVHRLGPQLMQKISESVQHVMSTHDKVATTPEIANASRVSQTTPSVSPSTLLGLGQLKFDDQPQSFVSTPPQSKQLADIPVGNDPSQRASYFGLQVIVSLFLSLLTI
jgi:hypothetical protein